MELSPLSLMFPPLDRGGIFLPPVFLFEVEKGGGTKRSNFKGSPNVIVRESYSYGYSICTSIGSFLFCVFDKGRKESKFYPKKLI